MARTLEKYLNFIQIYRYLLLQRVCCIAFASEVTVRTTSLRTKHILYTIIKFANCAKIEKILTQKYWTFWNLENIGKH